jgi:hypothetical protein
MAPLLLLLLVTIIGGLTWQTAAHAQYARLSCPAVESDVPINDGMLRGMPAAATEPTVWNPVGIRRDCGPEEKPDPRAS